MTGKGERTRGTAGEAKGPSLKAPFTYEGLVLVRPVGRGIVLSESEGEPYLEDLPDGYYHAQIRFEPLREPLPR